MTSKKRTKTKRGTSRAPRSTEPRIDPRITDALNKLDGALLYVLADTVGTAYPGTIQHNIAVAARSATDIRSILMLGGDES